MKELVVGFDARKMTFSDEEVWSSERKRTFLLKSEVKTPLSVDTSVWSSIFDTNKTIERPERSGWRQNTWSNLSELLNYLQSQPGKQPTNYWIIAITQIADDQTIAENGLDVLPVIPNAISHHWQLLGYDVAEFTLLSSLMNMGYRDEERDIAESKFMVDLNPYHLFMRKEVAEEFADWSNNRDKGHGPFYVYGLYLISEN